MVPTLNLETFSPPPNRQEAVTQMRSFLGEQRRRRARVVKIIHGYGSSGKGGVLWGAVRRELEEMRRRQEIRAYLPGEELHSRSATVRALANDFPAIRKLPEYGRANPGLTVVVLNR